MSEPFPPTALQRRHTQTGRDSSSGYKIVNKNFLNPEGHENPINGSKVMAILLKWSILPIGGASAVEGLQSTELPPLVFIFSSSIFSVTIELHFDGMGLHGQLPAAAVGRVNFCQKHPNMSSEQG